MRDKQLTSRLPLLEGQNRQYQYVDKQGAISTISVDEYRFAGVNVFSVHSRQEREVRVVEYQDRPVLNLYFSLEGRCESYQSQRDKNYPVKDRQHTVSYAPRSDGYYTLQSPGMRTFGVALTESFFQRLMVDDQQGLQRFWEKVQAGKVADLTEKAMPVTPEQLFLIREMQQSAYSGQMKQLFYEAKIVELFLLQVQQAERLSYVKPDQHWLKDKDKLYAARDFLGEHLFEPITLLQVARSCGLNDFKLKKGFKELFGTTVFGYFTGLKMNYGRQMLLDTSCSVGEVAFLLGYSDPYSFSKAFRKHFGCLPGKLKNPAS